MYEKSQLNRLVWGSLMLAPISYPWNADTLLLYKVNSFFF